jgi:hypothetical protein
VRLKEIDLLFEHLPDQFDRYRILHLTDPHFDGVAHLGLELAGSLSGIEVDLCAITGDFCFDHRRAPLPPSVLSDIARLQRAVTAHDGFLATLGNHDSHRIVDQLEQLGLRVLVNESVALRRKSDVFLITGTDDVHRFYTAQAGLALTALSCAQADQRTFGLVLVHSPELAEEAARAGYHLYLCGHTHAGQVCLPNKRPVLMPLNRNHALSSGLWRVEALTGYTSAGIGTAGLPFRVFCPAEATIFTLRRPGD